MDLGSIVYSPSAYYGGIQAIMLNAYKYKAIDCFTANKTVDQPVSNKYKDDHNSLDPAYPERTFVPNVVMNYYLNPKSAFIDTDASKFEFVATDAAYTRAFSGSDLKVKSVSQEKIGGKPTGLFTVVARVNNANKIKTIDKDADVSQVTVAALRYADGDTAVISDFAALKRQMNTNFSVRYADGNKLYANQDGARDNSAVLSFERGKELDLTKAFKAYYSQNGNSEEVEFKANDMNNAGFKLDYELIGYLTKDNDAKYTNQSERCEIKDGKLYLQDAKPGDEGRTPIIRVKLVDTNNGNAVAAVGYVKVLITEKIAEPIVLSNPINWKASYTLVCENGEFNTFKMTWQQMEDLVLNKVGLSKADFEKIYELKVDASSHEAIQYKENNGTFTQVQNYEKFGVVKFTDTGDADAMTNVLKWTIYNGEAYLAAKNKNIAAKQVIVAWTPKTDVAGYKSRGIIYATLQWTIDERNINPEASIKNEEDKTYALWAENYAYAKAGVNSNCDFNVTTTSSFNKDPYSIVKERLGSYSSLLKGMEYEFTSAESTKGYNLVVSLDRKEVRCNGETLVSIGADGKTLTYADNTLAKQILNSDDEPLTVKIKMIPTSCAPAEGVIVLNNDEYAMKYIRPMTITENKAADIVDRAEETKISKVTMKFKNWLGEEVDYAKYELNALVQNPNVNVTTNFNKGGNNFEAIPEGLKVSYDGSEFDPANGKYGKIYYWRSESLVVVQDFKVRVPILVNYKWGQIPVTLEFTVKKTK